MKKYITSLFALMMLPGISSAQIADSSNAGAFEDLLENILVFSNDVLIPFIIGIGFLVFVFGMFKFFILGGANDEKKEQGKSLMIYATIGFVLIIIFFGVVNLLSESTGLTGETIRNVPRIDVP